MEEIVNFMRLRMVYGFKTFGRGKKRLRVAIGSRKLLNTRINYENYMKN